MLKMRHEKVTGLVIMLSLLVLRFKENLIQTLDKSKMRRKIKPVFFIRVGKNGADLKFSARVSRAVLF
jgi:hypothetical protein